MKGSRIVKTGAAAVSLLYAFGMPLLTAQVEVLPDETRAAHLKTFERLKAENGPFQKHLKRMEGASDTRKINAARVASDFVRTGASGPVVFYSVPAAGEAQYLPDAYPYDGMPGEPLRIFAALDEYENASFLLYPLEDIGKADFEIGDLVMKDGTVFSGKDIDLRTVKVWYQNGNAWYSYFQDSGLKLCPELLLHDEDLIRVDTKEKANFARITGKDGNVFFRWLTPDRELDNRSEDAPTYWLNESFFCMKPEFQDSADFKGASLREGEFKQFLLTLHAGKDRKPGIYEGHVTVRKAGRILCRIPLRLRILPFVLPPPKTYSDTSKDFRMFMCDYISLSLIRMLNGNDPALAEKQLVAILKDFVAHGETMPHYRGVFDHPEYAREAGCDLSVLVTRGMYNAAPADRDFDVRRCVELHKKKFGSHEGYYMSWGDEYGLQTLRMIRPMVKAYQQAGFRFTVNSSRGYQYGGYLADLLWPPVWPDQSSSALTSKYNFMNSDGLFGWYAMQHVGVENPAFIRRQYGLGPYRAGLSCHYNYAHHLYGYNDLRGDTYRSMNLVYGDGKGVIDTLAYEALREGLDDIRYATALQLLARPLAKSGNVEARYAAKKALQFLAELDTDAFDLASARLEMIRHILTLLEFRKQETEESR